MYLPNFASRAKRQFHEPSSTSGSIAVNTFDDWLSSSQSLSTPLLCNVPWTRTRRIQKTTMAHLSTTRPSPRSSLAVEDKIDKISGAERGKGGLSVEADARQAHNTLAALYESEVSLLLGHALRIVRTLTRRNNNGAYKFCSVRSAPRPDLSRILMHRQLLWKLVRNFKFRILSFQFSSFRRICLYVIL